MQLKTSTFISLKIIVDTLMMLEMNHQNRFLKSIK